MQKKRMMRGPKPRRTAALLFVLAWSAVALPDGALGNGGTLRLANVPMGEYRVSVFTDPTPVRPDSLDVSVLVLHEGRLGLAEGVEVWVRAEALDHDGGPHRRQATREQADDPRYHSAKFALGSEGTWRITVEVRGEYGEGSGAFEVRARQPGLWRHPLVATLLALIPLLLAGWWILRSDEGADEAGVSPDARPEEPSAAPGPAS